MYSTGEDMDNNQGYACVEAGGMWEVSVTSSPLPSELKTALKIVN